MGTVSIRSEERGDRAAVHAVHAAAFPTTAEADLVDALRAAARPLIALVADVDGSVVGHVLFTPVELAARPDLRILGLAPLAVDPRHQRRGIGSQLVVAGLERCRAIGADAVVVLGDARYYARFGFSPSVGFGFRSAYEVPDDVFQALELRSGSLRGASGQVRYHAAFDALGGTDTLRRAVRADLAGMHRVRLAVRENRLVSLLLTEADYAAAIEPPGRGWVVESGGRVVAFAVADSITGNIWALFVDPEHERRGHGRRLLDVMTEWLWSTGLTRLWLTTAPGTRAESFYTAAGWHCVGQTPNGELQFERTRDVPQPRG